MCVHPKFQRLFTGHGGSCCINNPPLYCGRLLQLHSRHTLTGHTERYIWIHQGRTATKNESQQRLNQSEQKPQHWMLSVCGRNTKKNKHTLYGRTGKIKVQICLQSHTELDIWSLTVANWGSSLRLRQNSPGGYYSTLHNNTATMHSSFCSL